MDKIITSRPVGMSELLHHRHSCCVISFSVGAKVGTRNPTGMRDSPLRTLSVRKVGVLSQADGESEGVIWLHVG